MPKAKAPPVDLEKYLEGRNHNYLTYQQAARLYGLPYWAFVTVDVSQEFAVRVTDSYNDESKSEGQFAVVSFAYIGGILKMLKSEEDLSEKEYPLILDGPFSKLDPDQRQNVVNTIPKFAPQVIIFSKDDLHDVFDSDVIGRVWTIISNEEKNVARVEEGNLWR